MRKSRWGWLCAAAALLLSTSCVPEIESQTAEPVQDASVLTANSDPLPQQTPEPPPEKLVRDILNQGVVIVISKASQEMHVFRDGALWQSSPVSTGKRGKETPSGVFAILQKRKFHRSNLYSNAPMPFMQRLTWDGIAIHAGRLPGYPASHGCIRLPHAFAKELFNLTGFASTGVIVVDEAIANSDDALKLARRTDAAIPMEQAIPKDQPVRIATAEHEFKRGPPVQAPPPTVPAGPTIQLAAASTEAEARAYWDQVARAQPELSKLEMQIIPAMVDGQKFYRLRATGPEAPSRCEELQNAGFACFPVS